MEQRLRNIFFCLIVWLCACGIPAQAQLRVVTWNTAGGPRTGVAEVLEAIGHESVNGIAKPIDVLSLQEQSSSATTTQAIVDILNGIHGTGTYNRATLDGDTNGAGRPGLIYNTTTVSLLSQQTLGMTSTSGQARQTLFYELQPVGYESSLFVFSSHYKAGTGSSNEARRMVEATAIRDFTDAALPEANIIYSGDFNIRSSSDDMYVELLSPGGGQAFDPINTPGRWHDASAVKAVHTQAPADNPASGLVGSGVNDRFDFQLVTDELLDGEGFSYVPGSYRAFGNNGTHTLSGDISSGTGASAAILSALESASDHLPVVADYQVPAVFDIAAASDIPTQVELGSHVEFTLTIENIADVVVPIGADELDYELVGVDGFLGSFVDSDMALGGGNTHTFTLDTSTLGFRSGSVAITNNSPEDPSEHFFTRSFTVVPAASPTADFDQDGDVDGQDYLIWQRGFQVGASLTEGDADVSGFVDDADLAIWHSQYENAPTLGTAQIPEPSSVCLLLFGFAGLVKQIVRTQGRG